MKTGQAILESAMEQGTALNERIAIMQDQMIAYQELMRKTANVYQRLEDELLKMGLQVDDCYYPPFINDEDRDDYQDYLQPGAGILMNIRAVERIEKFKFIEFKGYNEHGENNNKGILHIEAARMNKLLSDACKAEVEVNPYTLQAPSVPDVQNRILIDVIVK